MPPTEDFRLLFLDLETTGHDPLKNDSGVLIPWHEIIDIGAVAVSSITLEIYGDFEMKIAPLHPERCLQNLINHYKERSERGEWKDAQTLPLAIHSLFHFCENNGGMFVLVGQNFFFDWSFLSVAFALCDISEELWSKHLHYSKLDTRSMAVQELSDRYAGHNPKNFSLRNGSLQKQLGIVAEPEPHTALNGAYQAYKLYKALHKRQVR